MDLIEFFSFLRALSLCYNHLIMRISKQLSFLFLTLVLLAACGNMQNQVAVSDSSGGGVISLTLQHPNATDTSISKSLADYPYYHGVSKAISISPTMCSVSAQNSSGTLLTSKNFTFAATASVSLSVDPQSSVSLGVNCNDSNLAGDDGIEAGYQGSGTINVSTGTNSVAIIPKWLNVSNDDSDTNLSSLLFNQTSGSATFDFYFGSALTDAQKAATTCYAELNLTRSSESRVDVDTTQTTCATSSAKTHPYLSISGGVSKPICAFYNASNVKQMKTNASWTTDASSNTVLRCSFSDKQLDGIIDSGEVGSFAAACRTSSSGDCDAVPNTGYALYNFSGNTNSGNTGASTGSSCTTSNNGNDCATGFCTVNQGTGGTGTCTALAADTNAGTTTVVGGSSGTAGVAMGSLSNSQFFSPNGIVQSHNGDDLYISDAANDRIVKVDLAVATGNASYTTRCCGQNNTTGSGNGACTLLGATFNSPGGVAIDSGDDNLYIADSANHLIRKVTLTSTGDCDTASTVAGTGSTGSADGTGTAAAFSTPQSLVISPNDINLFVTDRDNHTIRQIVISSGVVTTIAGSAGVSATTNGDGTASRFSFPTRLTIDSTGTNLYIVQPGSANIRQMNLGSTTVSTLTITGVAFSQPSGIWIDPTDTNLFVTDQSATDLLNQVVISTGVSSTILAGSASLNNPTAVFVSHDGTTVWLTDTSDHEVLKSE